MPKPFLLFMFFFSVFFLFPLISVFFSIISTLDWHFISFLRFCQVYSSTKAADHVQYHGWDEENVFDERSNVNYDGRQESQKKDALNEDKEKDTKAMGMEDMCERPDEGTN